MLPAIPDSTNFIKNSFASSAYATGNISAKTTMSTEQWWNYTDRGKNQSTLEKPAPFPFGSPQIPHGLTWHGTRASTVRGR